MVDTRRLRQLIEDTKERLVLPPGPVAIALSGGADSAVLALLLGHSNIEARALHVDHGLPSSPRLREAATEIANLLDLPISFITVDLRSGPSPEGRARRVRYQALIDALRTEEWLATGHTMDDQAETTLWAMLRGAGREGLGAMMPLRKPIVRPILAVTRTETREIAMLAGLPFLDDPMNLDLSLTRNSIRRELMPLLESRYNPRLTEALSRMARSLRLENDLLDRMADDVTIERWEEVVRIPVGELRSAHPAVAGRALRRATRLAHPPYAATAHELERIMEVVSGRAASTQLEGGITVRLAGAHLVLDGAGQTVVADPVDLVPGSVVWGRFRFDLEVVEGAPRVFPLGSWGAVFAADARLTVRVARASERVGVPDDIWPMVEVDGEVGWIPGVRRLAVAFYERGAPGYLSVFATEENGWTSTL